MSLDNWIQTVHLTLDSVQQYRKAFASHPARALVLKNVLLDSEAENLSKFLADEAEFELAYGLYAHDAKDGNRSGVSPAEWLAAEAYQRFYRFSDFAGVLNEAGPTPNRTVFQEFLSALRGDASRRFFESISGLELGPAPLINAYSYRTGDFLSEHTDNVKGKRLSFVFYLSGGWETRFGGLLHLIHPDGRLTTVEPDYNSLVVFDVAAQTGHFINPVEESAGARARLTISGWFLKP
jgi:hypothetical protein